VSQQFVMDFGVASASHLPMTYSGGTTQPGGPVVFGPDLWEDMGEVAFIEALNTWGSTMHREVFSLRADLNATQAGVTGAFGQAQDAVRDLVTAFRAEVVAMRQTTAYEANQTLANLERVVAEARARFGEQDARFAADLSELAQRLQAADAWAQAEPARVAAIVQAAPPWLSAPPVTPPQRAAQPFGADSPGHLTVGPALVTSPAWATYAAGRTAAGPAPHDAWAAAAAAAATGGPQRQQQQPQPQPQPQPQRFEMNTPNYAGGNGGFGGGKGGGAYPKEQREMRLDARGWTSQKLDVGVAIDAFQIWKDRAMMFLSRDRPDVRKLLCWAETQSQDTLRDGLAAQAAAFNVHDLAGVEYALHDGIKMTLQDTLLGRARGCIERGCELWRALCAEWSGAAPQLQAAKARRYMNPPTCKNVQDLWARLPQWERLGEEVELSGVQIAPVLAIVALDTLLPTQLRDALVSCASQGSQLATYAQRLAWVKVQMEHSRGLTQAAGYAPHGKDASGDVNMYSVDDPPGLGNDAIENMTWCMAEAAHAGDWTLVDSLHNSIYAMKGSKGGGFRKGLGKGKPGKGAAPPAAAAKGGGATAEVFQGICNHCHIWGHRKTDCRKLDKELAAKGGSKGKAGGKGSPTGGKGPAAAAATLAEVGADDDHWAGELLDSAIAGAAAEFDEWDFAHAAVCSLRADTAPAPRASYATMPGGASASTRLAQQYKTLSTVIAAQVSNTGAAASASSRLARRKTCAGGAVATLAAGAPAIEVKNSFAALGLLTDDAEDLLAAVSGDGGGQVVEAVVDSGAVHSVTPPGWFPGKTVSSAWSRAGRGYRAANGTAIKNLGQVTVKFATATGDRCSIPFQVAEVEQPLLSVAHLTSAGNRVELGHDSGRVVNLTTGRAIALERRGGVYIMRMFIANGVAPVPAPFRRQGASVQ
jgi:hypothetical protein